MSMKIDLIRAITPPIKPSTKKQWATAIGFAMILAYMLGRMIIDSMMR